MALSVKLYRVVGKGKDRRYIPIDLGRRGRRSTLAPSSSGTTHLLSRPGSEVSNGLLHSFVSLRKEWRLPGDEAHSQTVGVAFEC